MNFVVGVFVAFLVLFGMFECMCFCFFFFYYVSTRRLFMFLWL